MTLRQDCELWATFDSEDVDANRGIVRDRSGKGRTLQASGGPTYGQASPVGGAVGFDGADDSFQSSNVSTSEFTVCAILKTDVLDGTFRQAVTNDTGSVTNGLQFGLTSSNTFANRVPDGSGTKQTVEWSGVSTDNYFVAVSDFDGSTLRLIVNGDTKDTVSMSGHTLSSDPLTVGATTDNKANWDGEIAFTAYWSRALSDSEIEELTRMTDRMVSEL